MKQMFTPTFSHSNFFSVLSPGHNPPDEDFFDWYNNRGAATYLTDIRSVQANVFLEGAWILNAKYSSKDIQSEQKIL
eukprot:4896230-Amphidinium_carterae.1